MLLSLKDDTLSRLGAVTADPVPDYGVWQAQDPRGPAVHIPNDVNLMAEEFDIAGLELIVLDFPKYRDGRAYTQARILRQRYGFAGDIRAAGDVLRDQIQFMARCGFTSFDLPDGASVEGFTQSLRDFSLFYQPAATGVPVWQLRAEARAGTREGVTRERRIA